MFQAHRLLYHSILGLGVIQQKKKPPPPSAPAPVFGCTTIHLYSYTTVQMASSVDLEDNDDDDIVAGTEGRVDLYSCTAVHFYNCTTAQMVERSCGHLMRRW